MKKFFFFSKGILFFVLLIIFCNGQRGYAKAILNRPNTRQKSIAAFSAGVLSTIAIYLGYKYFSRNVGKGVERQKTKIVQLCHILFDGLDEYEEEDRLVELEKRYNALIGEKKQKIKMILQESSDVEYLDDTLVPVILNKIYPTLVKYIAVLEKMDLLNNKKELLIPVLTLGSVIAVAVWSSLEPVIPFPLPPYVDECKGLSYRGVLM